jgi:hypothetical protein
MILAAVSVNIRNVTEIRPVVSPTGIQGGSDKSEILKIFLENLTAQRKIIRFYKTKKKLTEGHIENQDIQ